MHPPFAKTTDGWKLFYWNLDGAVGVNGQNNFDDVLFVQWCMYKASKWPGIDNMAKLNNIDMKGRTLRGSFAKVTINGRCSGMKDDPPVDQITLLQALPHGKIDGRINPIQDSVNYQDHWGLKYLYSIIWLNSYSTQ